MKLGNWRGIALVLHGDVHCKMPGGWVCVDGGYFKCTDYPA